MADPYAEEQMTLDNEKINDVGKNNWLELQDQEKLYDNQMKELVASHVEDQQRSQAETKAGKRDPPEMGPNEQVSKMLLSHHGPAYSLNKTEYGLGAKN